MYIGNQPYQIAFVVDTFNGNNSTTVFTMSVAPANTASVLVVVSGVVQDPSTYSVSGTTLTFSGAPPSGTGNISARYLGIPASNVTTTAYRTVTNFTATSGQTTFSPPSYTAGFINVYRNGVYLPTPDYTATNGTTVVLNNGCTTGDTVTIESFLVSSVLNAIPATAGAVTGSYIASGAVGSSQLANLTTLPTSGGNITLPAVSGTAMVSGNMPAFSAYPSSNQSISSSTFTKILFQTTEFDTTSGMYSSSRFTPTVAGYYQIQVAISPNSATTATQSAIYKNGSLYKRQFNNGSNTPAEVVSLVYLNGSSDYVEGWGYLTGVSPIVQGSSDQTFFQAVMVRSA